MKTYYLFILSFFILLKTFGQKDSRILFDTSHSREGVVISYYYSKTNFSFIDTLSHWRYDFDSSYKGFQNDSIKPMGQLIFWKINSIGKNLLYTPHLEFDVFNLRDSEYCYNMSSRTRIFSSCVPPGVGGDILIIGKLILLNRNACVSCYDLNNTKIDKCRATINYIFLHLNSERIRTIQDLTKIIRVKKGSCR